MAEGFRKEMEDMKKSIQTHNQVNSLPPLPQLQPLPLVASQPPTDTIQNTPLNNYTAQVPQLAHQTPLMMPQVPQIHPWNMMPISNPQYIC